MKGFSMNAVPQSVAGSRVQAIAPWAVRGGLLLWGGFWAWFVLAVGIGDIRSGLAGTAPVMAAWFVSLTALVAAAWRWPRLGGLALIVSGIGAAYFFQHPAPWLMLSLPAVVLGGLSVLIGRNACQAGRMPR